MTVGDDDIELENKNFDFRISNDDGHVTMTPAGSNHQRPDYIEYDKVEKVFEAKATNSQNASQEYLIQHTTGPINVSIANENAELPLGGRSLVHDNSNLSLRSNVIQVQCDTNEIELDQNDHYIPYNQVNKLSDHGQGQNFSHDFF